MEKKHELEEKEKIIKYPSQKYEPGDSINEHRAIEIANMLIAENEIGQQNENL